MNDVHAPASGPERVRLRRLAGAGLLAAAVAAVVALDTGLVPLPYSTPVPAADGPRPVAVDRTTAADQARVDGVQATVSALDAALGADDVDALVALVDPAAPAEVVEHVRRVGRNLGAMPATDAGLTWTRGWDEDTTGDGGADRRSRGFALVHLTTFVRGYDRAAGHDPVRIGLRANGGRWLVTSWTAGDTEELPPWEADVDLVTVAKPHVLLVGSASNRRVNERLAARAEAAAVDARTVWTTKDWNGKAVVVALGDRWFLDGWFGVGKGGPGQESSDWFHVFRSNDIGGQEADLGYRAVLATDFLRRDDRVARADLRYMFSLLSMRSFYSVTLPAWLYCGSADYTAWRPGTGRDAVGTLRRRGLATATWTGLAAGTWRPRLSVDLETFGEGDRGAADWDSAFLAATYVAATFGEARLRRLVTEAAFNPDTDAVIGTVLGLTRTQFTSGVARYSRQLARSA